MNEHKFLNTKTHPSWGMLSFSRVSGSADLFGSNVNHQHFIEMRVHPGKRSHDHGHDYYFADNKSFIEVRMSAAQFAEAITSMNMGSGVPCTIKHFNSQRVEQCPREKSEADRAKDHFNETFKESDEKITKDYEAISAILSKPSIGKADRETVKKLVADITRSVRGNLPFYLDQFHEVTEKITAKAKTEFESMVTHHFTRIGLEHLQSQLPTADKPKEIE
jgi:hypothetical protein